MRRGTVREAGASGARAVQGEKAVEVRSPAPQAQVCFPLAVGTSGSPRFCPLISPYALPHLAPPGNPGMAEPPRLGLGLAPTGELSPGSSLLSSRVSKLPLTGHVQPTVYFCTPGNLRMVFMFFED